MTKRCTLALALVTASLSTESMAESFELAPCLSDECMPASDVPVSHSEIEGMEAEFIRPPEMNAAEVSEPEAAAAAPAPASSPRHFRPWIFMQIRQFAAAGVNRGSLYTTDFDVGVGIPLGTPYLSMALGASLSLGAYQDVTERTVGMYMGMGMFLDARLRLNVEGPARMFVVSGARINLGGPLDHGPDPVGDECPSFSTAEGSFGFGAEFSWGRQGLVSMSLRGVRRRALGEMHFAADSTNPPLSSTRAAWGFAATIQLGAHFD